MVPLVLHLKKKKTSLTDGVGGILKNWIPILINLETLFEGTLENWARMIPDDENDPKNVMNDTKNLENS